MSLIRVLHIGISSESGVFGGVERFMTDYYQHINHQKVHFDFLFCRANSLLQHQNLEYMKTSSVKGLHVLKDEDNSVKNFLKLYRAVRKELSFTKYDIVHVDTSLSPVQIACLYAAKKEGIKVRIAHSHSSGRQLSGNGIKRFLKRCAYATSKGVIRYLATDYFACSKEAGVSLFGEKGVNSKEFRLIKNAIDAGRYRFNPQIRKGIREEYGVSPDCVVFGAVGRLDPVKNLLFSFSVFSEYQKNNSNSEFWIVGDGQQRTELVNRVCELGLKEKIRFLGQKSNIAELMQGMDLLLFPSIHEGLGITAIEGQAAGLPVYASDKIPREAEITELITFLPLALDASEWNTKINESYEEFERKDTFDQVCQAGYEIHEAAKKLEKIYQERLEDAKC